METLQKKMIHDRNKFITIQPISSQKHTFCPQNKVTDMNDLDSS